MTPDKKPHSFTDDCAPGSLGKKTNESGEPEKCEHGQTGSHGYGPTDYNGFYMDNCPGPRKAPPKDDTSPPAFGMGVPGRCRLEPWRLRGDFPAGAEALEKAIAECPKGAECGHFEPDYNRQFGYQALNASVPPKPRRWVFVAYRPFGEFASNFGPATVCVVFISRTPPRVIVCQRKDLTDAAGERAKDDADAAPLIAENGIALLNLSQETEEWLFSRIGPTVGPT